MGLFDIFRRAPAIRDVPALAEFIDGNAAFIAQKGIYEYSRARAGHYSKVLFREPEFLDELCEQIAEGATLYAIAKQKDIRYSKLFQWVKASQDRADAYEEAIEARDQNVSDRVLTGVLAVTNTTVKDFLNDDGTPKDVSKLGEEAAFALQEVGVSYADDGTVSGRKVKAHDKMKALEAYILSTRKGVPLDPGKH